MLKLTTRLAVNIRYLADWEVDWSDTCPQRSRESLTISDFLPTEEDAKQLRERDMHYTMEFLVTEFSSLSDLKCHVSSQQPFHAVQKTQVVPMSVLFKDELYKSETVEILTQYITDAQLSGDHQVSYIKQIYCWVLARGSATFWIQTGYCRWSTHLQNHTRLYSVETGWVGYQRSTNLGTWSTRYETD